VSNLVKTESYKSDSSPQPKLPQVIMLVKYHNALHVKKKKSALWHVVEPTFLIEETSMQDNEQVPSWI